jgi:hypothetical protein
MKYGTDCRRSNVSQRLAKSPPQSAAMGKHLHYLVHLIGKQNNLPRGSRLVRIKSPVLDEPAPYMMC